MKRTNEIFLLCFVTSVYWFSLYTYIPIISPYIESLGISYKMIGIIAGSAGFAQMVLRLPIGLFSDAIKNRKLFIILGLMFSIVSSIGMWYFKTAIPLLIFRFLSGAAAATWVAFIVLFTSFFHNESTSKSIGVINSFSYFGQMIGLLVGGIVAQNFGERSTFLLSFVTGIIGIVPAIFIFEKSDIISEPLKTSELIKTVKDRNLILSSFLAIICQLVIFASVFGFTPIVAKKIGATNFELSIMSTLSIFPLVFTATLSGTFFAKRYGESKTIAAGFILSSIACIATPLLKTINLLYISQFISGLGRGLTFTLLMSFSIKDIEYKKRATAMSFFQAVYGLGMFLGPVIVGFLSDIVSLSWGFYITGLVGIAGAFLSMQYIAHNGKKILS